MFFPSNAAETLSKTLPSFSALPHPATTNGKVIASATAFATSAHSSGDLSAPSGEAPFNLKHMKSASVLSSTYLAHFAGSSQTSP